MTPFRSLSMTTLAAAALTALGACSSLPPGNPTLEMARAENRTAQATAQTQALAPLELSQAAEAMARAEAALVQREDADRVTQLAYLARQRVALAQETAARKASEAAVVEAGARRDQLRLEARTREADDATRRAGQATQAANSAQQQAASAQRSANQSQQQADAARQIAAASQMQAGATESRNQALEAQLSPGGLRSVERLGAFLVAYPQRQALIEGYTDSVGSTSSNQSLSERRADAVLTALLGLGVARTQLTAQGYGETFPVAGNTDAGGRQMNRRVEVMLSDETGKLIRR